MSESPVLVVCWFSVGVECMAGCEKSRLKRLVQLLGRFGFALLSFESAAAAALSRCSLLASFAQSTLVPSTPLKSSQAKMSTTEQQQPVPMETETQAAGKGVAEEEKRPEESAAEEKTRGVIREKPSGAQAEQFAIDVERGEAGVGARGRRPSISAASRADAKRMLQRSVKSAMRCSLPLSSTLISRSLWRLHSCPVVQSPGVRSESADAGATARTL